jgi:hypothetical protein
MNKRKKQKLFKNIHLPDPHYLTVESNKLLHDSRFWIFTGILLLLALLITLAILTGGVEYGSEVYRNPFNFYGPYY